MMEKASEFFLAFLQKNGMVTIVILAVLAVRFLLRKYPKKYSYWLWAIVGIRMLFDLPVASRFSLFNLFRYSGSGMQTAGAAATTPSINDLATENQIFTGTQNSQTVVGNHSFSLASAPAMTTGQMVFAALFFVWIAGMLLMLVYGIYSYAKCRKLVRTAVILKKTEPVCSHYPNTSVAKQKRQRTASVWECDQIPSPFVLGIFGPKIYIPFRMEAHEQQYILAHECYHIRRYDSLWKMLAFVLLSVYWWNPLTWIAFFYMVRDMEMSCDEAVIEFFGSDIKKDYSASLLAFAMERHPYSFAPIAFGEGDASKRIRNVLNFRKPRTWGAVIVIVIIAAVAVSCLTNRKEAENDTHFSTENSEKSEEAVSGTYAYEYNEEANIDWADFKITFQEDGTYSYYEGLFSSYLGFGTYSIENGILTMQDDKEACYDLTNHFRIEGDRIYFIEEGSDNFVYVRVKNGQSFRLTEDTDNGITPIDEETERAINQWAQAFTERDVNTILKLATTEAQDDLEKQQLLVGRDFGMSSPWPWKDNLWSEADSSENNSYLITHVDTQVQTADILYYAMVSDPHVTVWKETIHYTFENDQFRITQEALTMYDAISSGGEFVSAYPQGINGTMMDYYINGMGEILNERSVNYSYENDPLLDPVKAAQYLLNLSDNDGKVKLEIASDETASENEVLVNITFLENDVVWQVKMIQPWGENGIWIPQDAV